MSLTKFQRKKFKLMEVDGDFDFDFEKQVKEWSIKNSLLEKMYNGFVFESPEVGNIVNAVFVGSNSDFLMFDANFKDYVRVENRNNESRYLKNTNIGDKIDVLIVEIDDKDFMIKGSIATLYETRAHETLKSIDEDQSVMVYVRELTPAGYNVDVLHDAVTLPGFMPNTLAGINKLYDVESILGKKFEVMIESYSKEEGTYIVSRRKYLQSLIPDAIDNLHRGEVYNGHVTGTTQFGVFVEFGECLTGMIHRTNINPDWQDRISEIQPGFPIQFYVKEIVRDKIILTQILRESLWDSVKNGQTLVGKVKENKQFGTLVYLDQETIGLIHISELEKSGKSLSSGEEVKVKVIAVDRHNRKIFLAVNQ